MRSDVFYANGTLTKYQVVDTQAGNMSVALDQSRLKSLKSTAKASKVAAKAAGQSPKVVVSSYFSTAVSPAPAPADSRSVQPKTKPSTESSRESPKAVSETVATTGSSSPPNGRKRRVVVMDDDEFSSEDEVPVVKPSRTRKAVVHDDEEDEAPIVKRAKSSRVIVESDADDSEDEQVDEDANPQETTVESDVSSPAEEDEDKVMLEQERNPMAANWMNKFGRSDGKDKARAIADDSDDDGWHHVRDKKPSSSKPAAIKKAKPAVKFHASTGPQYSDAEESGDEYQTNTSSHDEVGKLLLDCEQVAKKLRASIQSWSGGKRNASDDEKSDEEQVTIADIVPTAKGDGRVVTQDDIPGLDEKLVLKPYQVVGINWLLLLCQNKVSGVLADEMGLGKTVQTVAFLQLLNSREVKKVPHLVVVPASVLNNWKREFAWIAPSLRVIVYHGAKEGRYQLQDTLTVNDFDILLTTYTYFERDTCQDDRNFLRSFNFGYMVLDEGHSIKNAKTSRFKRITAMRARNRLVLSGTPIQNNLQELLALLSFLMPRMFDHGSDELLSFFDGTEEKKCSKVRKILAPFILRREKKYVLTQLVAKNVTVKMLQIDEDQRKKYTNLIEAVIAQKEWAAKKKQEQKERKQKKRNKSEMLLDHLVGNTRDETSEVPQSDAAIFTQLRKAANHSIMLRTHFVSDEVLSLMSRSLHRADAFGNQCTIDMVRKELESYSDFELHDLCVQYSGNEELRRLQLPIETLMKSAKFDYLRQLLPKLQTEGHRVLIFSQWTKILDLLEVLMDHMSFRYMRLDGSTSVAERQGMIDTYNEDTGIFVFLLSTRAGGLGINLTAADTVILHDLDFNPTNDEQACDRCHRIGQTKPVSIYKLVSEDTVDHNIYKLGETKTQLNHAVLGKLNAHSESHSKNAAKGGNVTVEMMLASVLSSYKKKEEDAE